MRTLLIAVVLLTVLSVSGQEKNSGLQEISPGIFRLGTIGVNAKDRLISFPGTVNMTNGLLEYALVHKDGKVHESVLTCEAKPHQIHAAMLLLGLAVTNTVERAESSGQIEDPANIKIPGASIEISVAWNDGGKVVQQPLSAFIFNKRTRRALPGQPWVYNGSRFSEGRFLAELSGSIISLITDLDALINNTSAGHNDDTIWEVNEKVVPPIGTRVNVTIKAPPAKSPPKPN
jgi:hypothetical protein